MLCKLQDWWHARLQRHEQRHACMFALPWSSHLVMCPRCLAMCQRERYRTSPECTTAATTAVNVILCTWCCRNDDPDVHASHCAKQGTPLVVGHIRGSSAHHCAKQRAESCMGSIPVTSTCLWKISPRCWQSAWKWVVAQADNGKLQQQER